MKRLGLWLLPTVVVALVMAALSASYLGGSINLTDNINDFPIAVVDDDQGASLPTGGRLDAGPDLATGLVDGLSGKGFAVQTLTMDQAQAELKDGSLYGVIHLPTTLSADLVAWGTGALTPTTAHQPSVEVLTNPRIGSAAVTITTNAATTALASANTQLGQQLTAMVEGFAAIPSGTAKAALAAPLQVQVTAFDPLPGGTGSGLSAFYYALLLVLAGFTGTIAANTLIDASLGFLPVELGPVFRMNPGSGLSRRATLLVKWGVMAAIAVVVSGAYVLVASALGMPIGHPWPLWAFGAAMIWAVAVVAQAVQALLGNAGLLANLFIFIILGLPSAGGTIPLEAVPPFFRVLGRFEPMHQIYLGTRSILYFDATWGSGLGRALVAAAIATAAGLVIGLTGTTLYDRARLHRAHPALATPSAETAAA